MKTGIVKFTRKCVPCYRNLKKIDLLADFSLKFDLLPHFCLKIELLLAHFSLKIELLLVHFSLKVDPRERISVENLLCHPWVRQNGACGPLKWQSIYEFRPIDAECARMMAPCFNCNEQEMIRRLSKVIFECFYLTLSGRTSSAQNFYSSCQRLQHKITRISNRLQYKLYGMLKGYNMYVCI